MEDFELDLNTRHSGKFHSMDMRLICYWFTVCSSLTLAWLDWKLGAQIRA